MSKSPDFRTVPIPAHALHAPMFPRGTVHTGWRHVCITRNTIKHKDAAKVKDTPAQYAGLKFSGMPELLKQVLAPQKAAVIIRAESDFPHVPSKWERTLFSVALKMNGRDYIGNLNNLRQLHFGKNLAASLQLDAFPLQDRQIIRFLAINAQQDGTKLSLDAEQTAEFFHCLVGFQNFTRLNEKVVIHRELAEPVIMVERLKGGCLLRSAIIVKGSPLPLKDVKVITGRAGCWVGMLGEYWWIPAQMDVAWLRNFLRTTVQPCDSKAAAMLINFQAMLPFKLIETDGVKVREKKLKPFYNAAMTKDGALEIEILFDYDGRICKADQARLASQNGVFWKRNTNVENLYVQELVNFGFEMLSGASSSDGETRLILRDREAVGAFADELIPQWLNTGRAFLLSSDLAQLCGDSGRLRISTEVLAETDAWFDVSVKLTSASQPLPWRDLVAAAKNNELFISGGNGSFIKVPPALRRLAFGVCETALPQVRAAAGDQDQHLGHPARSPLCRSALGGARRGDPRRRAGGVPASEGRCGRNRRGDLLGERQSGAAAVPGRSAQIPAGGRALDENARRTRLQSDPCG
ncbi:MAG: hypothetical protein V8T87_06505 [Victivallales bacterium]